MLKYIFLEEVFLYLQNAQGIMIDRTLRQVMKHLQEKFCVDKEA